MRLRQPQNGKRQKENVTLLLPLCANSIQRLSRLGWLENKFKNLDFFIDTKFQPDKFKLFKRLNNKPDGNKMMTIYTYEIRSTVEVKDHNESFAPGDLLQEGNVEAGETFHSERAAEDYGQDVLNGTSGGPAFNIARDSAEISAVAV
jgi:hypothetical protein